MRSEHQANLYLVAKVEEKTTGQGDSALKVGNTFAKPAPKRAKPTVWARIKALFN